MDAPRLRREVLFEGLREDEILNLPKEAIAELVLIGEPMVFRIGSGERNHHEVHHDEDDKSV